jgi:hypothetical protein
MQTITMPITNGLAVYNFSRKVKLLSASTFGNNGENIRGFGFRTSDSVFYAYVYQWELAIPEGNINITLTWQE